MCTPQTVSSNDRELNGGGGLFERLKECRAAELMQTKESGDNAGRDESKEADPEEAERQEEAKKRYEAELSTLDWTGTSTKR